MNGERMAASGLLAAFRGLAEDMRSGALLAMDGRRGRYGVPEWLESMVERPEDYQVTEIRGAYTVYHARSRRGERE